MKPMLAVTYDEGLLDPDAEIIIQPKYDGIRALVSLNSDGSFNVVSRTGKPLVGLAGVMKFCTLKVLDLLQEGATLDGELVLSRSCGKSVDFNELSGLVRRLDPSAESEKTERLCYMIYDYIAPNADVTMDKRRYRLSMADDMCVIAGTEAWPFEIPEYLDDYVKRGYEGIMVRTLDGVYEQGKRSKGLIKVKKFDSDEFPIIGAIEGKGKLAGKLGAFEVSTPEGEKFAVKMATTDTELAAIWADKDSYMHEMLTVKFQGKSEKGIPRFPIGIAIRNYE